MRADTQTLAPAKKTECESARRPSLGAAFRSRLAIFALVPILAVIVSCHSSSPSTTTTVSVTVAPSTASLNVGLTPSDAQCQPGFKGTPLPVGMNTQFSAEVGGGTQNTVTWSVNGIQGGNSTLGVIGAGTIQSTLAPNGDTVTLTTYTAPACLPANTTITITATSTDDTSVVATATLTLLTPATVTVNPPTSTNIAPGTQIQFAATVTPAPSQDVIWEVNGLPSGFQTVGLISSTGLYTAPPSPPPGGSVTITAVSIADTTQSGTASVQLTFGKGSLQGQYAFTLKGSNASGTFVRAGTFVADGNGHISAGLEDVITPHGVPPSAAFVGTYTLGADGRGTLNFADGLTPADFRFVMPSNQQMQIISYDSGTAAEGVANLQNSASFKTSALLGIYIFDFNGLDSGGKAISEVGEFLADGAGGIRSSEVDIDDNGAISSQVAFTGSYSVNANGRGTAQLTTASGTLNFAFYVVSTGSLKFVSTDPSPAPEVTGQATQQAPGAVFTLSSLNGNYAFLMAGVSPAGNIATAGSFSTAGNGILASGVLDENNAGTVSAAQSFTGTYTVDSSGRGTATLNATNRTYTLVFYLDGVGGAVLQETDGSIVSHGLLATQTAASIAMSYAISLSGASQQFAGQATVASGGMLSAATLSGSLDASTDAGANPAVNDALSGALSVASGTRGTLSLNTAAANRNFVVYVASSSRIFVVQTDSGQFSEGVLLRQF